MYFPCVVVTIVEFGESRWNQTISDAVVQAVAGDGMKGKAVFFKPAEDV